MSVCVLLLSFYCLCNVIHLLRRAWLSGDGGKDDGRQMKVPVVVNQRPPLWLGFSASFGQSWQESVHIRGQALQSLARQ